MGHLFEFLLHKGMLYVVCSCKNRLIEAILMNTHNIPLLIYKRNHPKLSHMQ